MQVVFLRAGASASACYLLAGGLLPAIEAMIQAEQAIRPTVVTRKVCGGNRSAPGATIQQIVASVLRLFGIAGK